MEEVLASFPIVSCCFRIEIPHVHLPFFQFPCTFRSYDPYAPAVSTIPIHSQRASVPTLLTLPPPTSITINTIATTIMLNILGSLTKNGWRETFRMLRHSENTVRKQPSEPHKEYAHIRRHDKKGRKTRATAFQLVEEQQGNEPSKTYRRVNDGGEVEDDEVEELVVEKRTVVQVKEKSRRQRLVTREKKKGKSKPKIEERGVRV